MNLADIPNASRHEIEMNYADILRDPYKAKALAQWLYVSVERVREQIMQKQGEAIDMLLIENKKLLAEVDDLRAERQRDRRLVPEDEFCPHCDKPLLNWDGERYVCRDCGEV